MARGPAVCVYALRLLRRLLGPAGWWFSPAAGSLVDRQAPLVRALSAAGHYCSILVTRASPKWAWLQCRRPAGDRCSLTASCLLNGASPSREVASRLWRAGSVLGQLGEAGPPSGVSLPEGAYRPWAALTAHRGWHQGQHGKVPRRTGHGHPYSALCQACSGIWGWQASL